MMKRVDDEEDTLKQLMEPFMKLQVVSPEMFQEGLRYLSCLLKGQKEQAGEGEEAGEARYLPAYKIARRYGMTAKGIDPYLSTWEAQGHVEKINPWNPAKKRCGHALYNVRDVDRMMKSGGAKA